METETSNVLQLSLKGLMPSFFETVIFDNLTPEIKGELLAFVKHYLEIQRKLSNTALGVSIMPTTATMVNDITKEKLADYLKTERRRCIRGRKARIELQRKRQRIANSRERLHECIEESKKTQSR